MGSTESVRTTYRLAVVLGSFLGALMLGPVDLAGAANTTRLVAGSKPIRDSQGDLWKPAGRQILGKRKRSWRWPGKTASPDLYAYVAVGSRGIRPVVNRTGRYAVTLVTVNAALNPSSAGARFDVYSGKRRVATDIRVRRGSAISAIPLHTSFEIKLKKGRPLLRFRTRRGGPAIAAIQFTLLGPSSTAPLRPVLQERFNGPAGSPPDLTRWRVIRSCEPGPAELQCYTDRPQNVALNGLGNLDLTARRESYVTPSKTSEFTSARIESEAAFSLTRTRIRARIKFPAGRGVWSVFWALGARPVVWPDAGEIDIMEMLGQSPRDLHAFVHGRDDKGHNGITQNGADYRAPTPLSDSFHTYELRTVPGVAEFVLDGRTYGSIAKADLSATGEWPLDKRFNLIFSLSVGGRWVGPPDATTPFPAQMSISELQVYG